MYMNLECSVYLYIVLQETFLLIHSRIEVSETLTMRTLKFIKICCRECNTIALIPTYEKFMDTIPLSCEECGKTILTKNI
jgi:ribosomal protein S27E